MSGMLPNVEPLKIPDYPPEEDYLVRVDSDHSFDPAILRAYAQAHGDGTVEVRAWVLSYLLDRAGL